MPALAVGFEAYHEHSPFWDSLRGGPPRWLMQIDQQAGVLGWTMVSVEPHVNLIEGEGTGLWSEREEFGPQHLEFLNEVGRALFPDLSGPRLFLLWENAD